MSLIIDGYNLLHAANVVGAGRRGSSLQSSREALLRFVAAALEPADRGRTVVVFDAADAPPGLPRIVVDGGLTVRYAQNYADADALIEELIQADHAPRSLLVVSSDHRIQRAARRRRARTVDSDQWYAAMLRKGLRRRGRAPAQAKPAGPLSPEEVASWLAEFDVGGEAAADGPPRASEFPWDSPFPPGYGEDLA